MPVISVNGFEADLAHEVLDRLPPISCQVTRPEYNQRVAAALLGGRVAEIARAGHLAFLKQPQAMDAAISKFLET
jgi:3-oxoadipate enol-lactonase